MLFYEPVTIGKIVDYSFKMVFSNLKNILKIFAIYMGIILGLLIICGIGVFLFIKEKKLNIYPENLPFFIQNSNLSGIIISGIIFVLIFLIFAIVSYLFYSIMSFDIFIKSFLGEQWILKESFIMASKKFFSSLLLSFLSSLMMIGGFLLCCVGMFPIGALVIFSFPALIFENISPTKSISRSIDLVTKDFWKSFGYFMLLFLIISSLSIIYQVFASIANVFISFFFKDVKEFSPTLIIVIVILISIFFIINMIYSLFTSAFSSAYYILLYFNYRIKYENFGIERLTENIIEDEKIDSSPDNL